MTAMMALASQEAFDVLLVGISSVRERDLNGLAGHVYEGLARNRLNEGQGEILLGAIQLRHDVYAARRRVAGHRKPAQPILARPNDRQARARSKRRIWAGCGALPHELRSMFTHGENAVAAVIRAEVRQHGQCTLSWASIAQAAGLLSTTVVKRFVRLARAKGLIAVEERRVPRGRNLPCIITIISAKWLAWIALEPIPGRQHRGHGRAFPQTSYTKSSLSQGANRRAERLLRPPQGARKRESAARAAP